MNTDDYDVIEMNFPPYSEDGFRLPDIEQEESFNENKNEIYLRNIAIVKEEEARLSAEEKAAGTAKKSEFERMYQNSKPMVRSKEGGDRKAVGLFAVFSAAVIAISLLIAVADLGIDFDDNDLIEKADRQAFLAYQDCTSAAAENTDEEYRKNGFTIEGENSDIYIGDNIKADISEYRKSKDGYVYGSYSDGYGVDFALWSETPIPEEHRHIMTEKEAKKIAKKEGLVIGCYPTLSNEDTRSLSADESLPLYLRYTDIFDIQYDIVNIEPLKNYPAEYEKSGRKELAVTFDFTHENIKNDKGVHGLIPKVMCLDLGNSNYIKPFYGSSDNFETAYDGSYIMFMVTGHFSVTYFADSDELREAQGIAYRISEYEYAKSKSHDVPNFKIAFDSGTRIAVDEYLKKEPKEEENIETVPDILDLMKTTAIREPFEATDTETVYNSKTVSVKIEPSSSAAYTGEGFYLPEESNAKAKITIKNLTDIDYKIRPYKFGIEFDRDYYREITYSVSEYNEYFAEYDENEELLLGFDENNLCCFTVTAWGNNAYLYYYLKYDMPPSKKGEHDVDGFKTKVWVEKPVH